MNLSLKSKRKIAITGIASGGKTVFLTSLLWQLREFKDSEFYLPKEVEISRFREVSLHGDNRKFPFHRNQDALAQRREWPKKTIDFYRFRCEFRRDDRRGFKRLFNRQQLDFFDFPGERIADAAIAAHDDFDDWSDHLLDYFNDRKDYSEAANQFLHEVESSDLSADEATRAYRQTLARFVLDCKPLISPSVFLLDEKGNKATYKPLEDLAAERICGLDERSQFVPLPESVRKANKKLAKEMRRHYQRYRKKLVIPLFREVANSDSLIVLVDIPSLLVGGVERYNDNRQIVLDLADVVAGTAIGGRLKRILGLDSLQQVAFVAAKADLVAPNDLKNGRLRSLLKQMTGQAEDLLPGKVDVKWFVCSACYSTRPGNAENTLIGASWPDNPERRKKQFPVSPLPESWPDDWKFRDYQFPAVYPDTPRNIQNPPKHRGLDEVFYFVAIH